MSSANNTVAAVKACKTAIVELKERAEKAEGSVRKLQKCLQDLFIKKELGDSKDMSVQEVYEEIAELQKEKKEIDDRIANLKVHTPIIVMCSGLF